MILLFFLPELIGLKFTCLQFYSLFASHWTVSVGIQISSVQSKRCRVGFLDAARLGGEGLAEHYCFAGVLRVSVRRHRPDTSVI